MNEVDFKKSTFLAELEKSSQTKHFIKNFWLWFLRTEVDFLVDFLVLNFIFVASLVFNNATCSSNSSCDKTKGLFCSSSGLFAGTCQCSGYTYWNGTTCATSASVNGACTATSQCRTDLGLVCISNVCACNTTSYWSTSSCGKDFSH